jgi:hypothetical protein
MIRLKTMIVSAFLIALASRAGAQASTDSSERQGYCRFAAQIITTGQPASWADFAFTYIGNCEGDGIRALAAGILNMKSSVDTAFLASLRQQAGYYADGAIFASAMSVAADSAASVPARVFALLTLQSITSPNSPFTYLEATSGISAAGDAACSRITRYTSDAWIKPGTTPLPADYEKQVSALAVKLYRDPTVPRLVRAASTCAM